MKYLITLSFLTLLSFSSAKAQYTLSIEAGYSDYITKQPSFALNEDILDGFVNFEPLRSWRVTIDRRFKKEKFIGMLGLTYYDVRAKNFFYDNWINIFFGIHIGAEYKIKKFRLGLHSYSAIRLDTSTYIVSLGEGLGGSPRLIPNIDITPSLGYAISDKLMTKLSFSYSLNKPIKTGIEKYHYRIIALHIGLQYELFGKKK